MYRVHGAGALLGGGVNANEHISSGGVHPGVVETMLPDSAQESRRPGSRRRTNATDRGDALTPRLDPISIVVFFWILWITPAAFVGDGPDDQACAIPIPPDRFLKHATGNGAHRFFSHGE